MILSVIALCSMVVFIACIMNNKFVEIEKRIERLEFEYESRVN